MLQATHCIFAFEICFEAAHLQAHDGDTSGLEKLVTRTLIKLWEVHNRNNFAA